LASPGTCAQLGLPGRIAAAVPDDRQNLLRFPVQSHAPGLVYGIVPTASGARETLGVQDLKAKRPVTADTLFRIASMSKAFTGLAI
jgi:CubicO group peptidase (beta-lactamase class C family)